jgi:RHS repeat-associated protein
MHIDSNKGKKIDYNFLNLPERVYPEGSGSDEIRFIYDASGVKWPKKVTGSNVTTTTYNGSFIYSGEIGNMSLDYALNSEGMIKNGASPQFHYFLKDHLGNTRAVIYDADADGQLDLTSLELLQQTDYYPFGMPFEPAPFGADNKYLYNGKEMQEDAIGGVGLDWFDYGARFYDPSLGRFHTLDPLAEKFSHQSPFVYADNNPIRFIDYMGMSADGYTVDFEGNFERVDDTGGNEYDVVYTKEEYEDAKSSGETNEYGNPEPENQVVIDKSFFGSQQTTERNRAGESFRIDLFETTNSTNSEELFQFVARETVVEWSRTQLCEPNGTQRTFLSTSHASNIEIGAGIILNWADKKGLQLDLHTHSHPGDNSMISPGDVNAARAYESRFANPSFSILLPHTKRYIPYNGNSSNVYFEDIIVTPNKK